MNADVLDRIRPTKEQRIIDAVAEAGIDVSVWARKADGSPVTNPAANPKYCYEWAFGGDSEPTALCVWYDNLVQSGRDISCENNLRDLALRLDAVAEDRFGDPEVASRSQTQAKRARRFDIKLQHAFRRQQDVRLILLAGTQRDLDRLGYDSSEVEYRQLDTALWTVASYDDRTGAFKLIREDDDVARRPEDVAYEQVARITSDQFADVFSDIDAALTGPQREMLVGHAMAPGRVLSMEDIAELGGHDSYATANIQYGAVGRKIADALSIDGLANQVQAFCELADERDSQWHALWIMREPAFRALVELGMLPTESTTVDESEGFDSSLDESPTTRRALVDARLGQGTFRKKMLRFWGGACAVTGCAVQEALVASHAVPWKDCSSRERLDHFNGLLLAGTLDRLFDAGLISFSDEGNVLVSPLLSQSDRESLGLTGQERLRRHEQRLIPYLKRHRGLHRLQLEDEVEREGSRAASSRGLSPQ